jgi:hypothetical protein
MMCWVYRKVKCGDGSYLFVVGYFVFDGLLRPDDGPMRWEPIEDCREEEQARALVHYLNGGNP